MTNASITPHPPTPEQLRAGWDRIAGAFDERVTPHTITIADELLTRIDLRRGTQLLDVAAGSGAIAIPAARRGAHVVAVDLSPAMIERLRARAESEGLRHLDARVMDGCDLDFPDDTFEVSMSLNGISVFPDFDAGLRELARVTAPGGRVLVTGFGPFRKAEFLTFFLGAVQATVPDFTGLSTDPPPLPFQIADPDHLNRRFRDAGLVDVVVEQTVWKLSVHSADQLSTIVASSNPIGAQLVGGLPGDRAAEVRRVLDGMLRERAGGAQEAVLETELNVAVGRVPPGT